MLVYRVHSALNRRPCCLVVSRFVEALPMREERSDSVFSNAAGELSSPWFSVSLSSCRANRGMLACLPWPEARHVVSAGCERLTVEACRNESQAPSKTVSSGEFSMSAVGEFNDALLISVEPVTICGVCRPPHLRLSTWQASPATPSAQVRLQLWRVVHTLYSYL